MARRVFLSYEHENRLTAKGFDLRYSKQLALRFIGRHLLDPLQSSDSAYMGRQIRQQITDSSLTIVILGEEAVDSKWVAREIQWSLEKKRPSGLLGIRLSPSVKVPYGLYNCRAEILEWYKPETLHEFPAAIERAAAAARRARYMPAASRATCARTAIAHPPPETAQPSSASEESQREQLSEAEKKAIAFAVDVTIDGLPQAAANRLADALGEEVWNALTHRWRPANCQALAELARALLELKAEIHDIAGDLADWLTDRLLARFERPTLEREVTYTLVRALVNKINWPTDAILAQTARTLRVIGIYICALGLDLDHCQCLKDLVEDLADDQARQELESIVRKAETIVRPHLTSDEVDEIVRNVLLKIWPPGDPSNG